MTAAHTPGPWYAGNDFVSADCGDGAQRRIAFIVPITDGTRERFATEQANARLIAAAPQLAEALRAAIECFETDPIPLPFAHARALLAARAALTAAGVQS